MSTFAALNPILQALLATLFTYGMTAAGAATVFLTKNVSRRLLDAMLGFAAGVMIAASFWSLLAPAIAMSEGTGVPRYVVVRQEGPDHDRTFVVEVTLSDARKGRGTGKNKKEAEQAAAQDALRRLRVSHS